MHVDSLIAGDSAWAMPIITDEKGFFYATLGSWIFWTPRTSEASDLFQLLARFKIQLLSGDQIHWWISNGLWTFVRWKQRPCNWHSIQKNNPPVSRKEWTATPNLARFNVGRRTAFTCPLQLHHSIKINNGLLTSRLEQKQYPTCQMERYMHHQTLPHWKMRPSTHMIAHRT